MFTEHGLQGASMDKIAAEAELAKGTLYLYYKNKDELLLALITMDIEKLNAYVQDVAESKAPSDEKLFNAFETFHSFSKDNSLFYQVMTQVNISEIVKCGMAESSSLGEFQHHNNSMMKTMVGIVQEGVDTGVFALTNSVEFVVMQLVLALKGTMVLMNNGMMPPEFYELDREVIMQEQARLLIRGLKGAA